MNGILVVDKPGGMTSHDVVAKVKRILKAKKVGHLGTLDPLATGVLPLVINKGTKFSRFFDAGDKEYAATLKLGEETDTYDSVGSVTAKGDFSGIAEEDIRRALDSFRGKIKQVPPMYSSIKRGGTPLYKLARKGEVVEREARDVEIFSIEATSINIPYVTFKVECSKGTYVRSICRDLGRALGCYAHLTELRRTKSSGFGLEDSVALDAAPEEMQKSLIPVEDALKRVFGKVERIEVDGRAAFRLLNGVPELSLEGDFFSFLTEKVMVIFIHKEEQLALGRCLKVAEGRAEFEIEQLFGGHEAPPHASNF